jgi:Lon protease-like protein
MTMTPIFLNQINVPKPYPKTLKILDITENVLFPGGHLPLVLTTQRHRQVINDSLKKDRLIGVVQKYTQNGQSNLQSTGCLGRITTFTEMNSYTIMVVVSGIARFRFRGDDDDVLSPAVKAKVSYKEYSGDNEQDESTPLDRDFLVGLLKSHINARGFDAHWGDISAVSNERLIAALATIYPFDSLEKQAILETQTIQERCQMLMALMEVSYLKQNDPTWKQ